MAGSFLELENRAGSPILAGGTRLIPISRALILKFPGMRGGVIWSRPVSVVARFADGQEQVIPIRDVTRRAQLALYGGALIGVLLTWLVRRQVDKRNFDS
jgi:hypothetical protein